MTYANILSNSVTIVYRIYRTNCQGVVIPLTADQIQFDIDASVSSFQPLNYTLAPDVQGAGSDSQSGTMNDVTGSDLFGDVGSGYAHWQTDQAVSITSSDDAVLLTITTGFVSSRQTDGLHTYLSFGQAAPVTVVVPMTSGH